MDEPLVCKYGKLEQFAGKGGWTYVPLPEIPPGKNAPFGWVRVRGFIDDHPIEGYHLMPMGNGQLFLPVKAAIRKKIKKKAGDLVSITLYRDDLPQTIPPGLLLCLQDEPAAQDKFFALTEMEQKQLVRPIYTAKNEQETADRIAACIDQLLRLKQKPARSGKAKAARESST